MLFFVVVVMTCVLFSDCCYTEKATSSINKVLTFLWVHGIKLHTTASTQLVYVHIDYWMCVCFRFLFSFINGDDSAAKLQQKFWWFSYSDQIVFQAENISFVK